MGISALFLQEKGQEAGQAVQVADSLAKFIRAARHSVHIAAYHFALKDPALVKPVQDALKDRSTAGVEIRIGYYFEHKFNPRDSGGVTQATGTEAFLGTITEGTDIELKPIRGSHLMHDKYAIRDGHTSNAAVWTGSTNFTDGAWKDMENNIVMVDSPTVCAFYENDFSELWSTGDIAGSGAGALDSGTASVDGTDIDVDFSPGKGRYIDSLLASLTSAARKRIKIASMVISSATLLGALADAVHHRQVAEFGGIYDGPETKSALAQATGGTPGLFDVIKPKLVEKPSRKFNPSQPDADYNYMHNKILVCDDVVLTGSFNFSHNATQNAENILLIKSKEWADKYGAYIDKLVRTYQS
jgi:phosphatidylserine/phosphatidylglycerophosphate/cardiolipin synthase-like enzyme